MSRTLLQIRRQAAGTSLKLFLEDRTEKNSKWAPRKVHIAPNIKIFVSTKISRLTQSIHNMGQVELACRIFLVPLERELATEPLIVKHDHPMPGSAGDVGAPGS